MDPLDVIILYGYRFKIELAFKHALHVVGAESWSWADIRNNGAVAQPGVNPWNEVQDPRTAKNELERPEA